MVETIIKLLKKLQNNIDEYKVKVNKSLNCDGANYNVTFTLNKSDICIDINENINNINIGYSPYIFIKITDLERFKLCEAAVNLLDACEKHKIKMLKDFVNDEEDLIDGVG